MDVDLCTYHFRSLKSGALVTPCNWKGHVNGMFVSTLPPFLVGFHKGKIPLDGSPFWIPRQAP